MFIKIPLTALLAGTLLLLVSCQPDNAIAPAESQTADARNLREGISPNMSQRHQLIKDGTHTLSYLDDGKLRKVAYGGTSVRGSLGIYTLYTYSAQAIVAKTYDESKLRLEIKYLLDPVTGRCSESQHTEYIPYGPNGTVVNHSDYVYQYNLNGQLSNYFNKKYTYEETVFGYNANGDLSKIIRYDKSGGNPGSVVISESTLYYDQPTGDPVLTDLYPLNSEAANLPDPYLRIFGKPSKNLVKLMTEKFSLGGRVYTYTLNADGYVTARNTYDVAGGALLESKAYEYLVTNLGFQL